MAATAEKAADTRSRVRTPDCGKRTGLATGALVFAVAFLMVAAGAHTVAAADKTWSGGSGANSQWNTAANWVGGVAVAPGDTVVYDANSVARLTNQTLGASISVGSIRLTGPVGPVTILPGNTLTISTATGIDLSAAARDLSVGSGVTLGAGQSWTVTNGRTLTVSGGVDGSAALTKAGAGVLTLSGSNAFSGGLAISAGSLRADRDGVLGTAAGDLTLSGGTLAVGSFYSGRTLAMTGDSAVNVARNFSAVWNGPLTGSSTLTLKGGYASAALSQLSLVNNAGNTFSGNIVVDVDGGTLKIGGNPYITGTPQQGLVLPNMTSGNTITVNRGAIFNIEDNVNGAAGYVADRLGSTGNRPAVSMAGGTFNLSGANNAAVMTQTLGPLTLASGPSVVNVTRVAGTPQLVFSSLIPTKGAFVNFTGTALGSGTADGRIVFTSSPDNIVGGGGAAGTTTMSLVPGARSGNDLVYYGAYGVRALVPAEYNAVAGANDINGAGTTENVKMTGTTTPFTALTADKTINSLVVNANVGASWSLGDRTLTLTSGQLIGGLANNTLAVNSGVLTAGSGSATDLDITIIQSTTTIGASINNNGTGSVALVKNGAGGLTLANSVDNTYSGGTFVNEGTLTSGTTADRAYLGTGPVRVNNAVLNLRAIGATSFGTANQAGYTVLAGGELQIPDVVYAAAGDRFDIRAGGILKAIAAGTAGNGLNSITRVSGLTGISGGQVVLAPGAIVAFNAGTTGLGVAPFALASGGGTAADVYFGLAASTVAASTITVGSGTPWLGLSTDRTGRSFLSGTITANGDFNLQGLGIPGVAPVALTMGSSGPVAINTPNGDVTVNILGAVAWNSPSPALGSNNKNVNFVVNPGATFTLNPTNALGASAGSTVSLAVQGGGILALAVPNAINAATTIQPGGKLNANLAGGLVGSGALTFASGSILEIVTQPTGFSGTQAAAATVSPGTIVRLNVGNFGSAVEPLDTYLGSKSPIYELYGANWAANPVATNTTIMTLNKDANGVGGMLVNDSASRSITAVPNGVIVIGPNGGTIAATTNTTLTLPQAVALGTNALTIGSAESIDGQPPKFGTVTLAAPLGYNTASTGSTITVIQGATLSNGANAIPDAADMIVNGTFSLGGAQTIGSLAGPGTVALGTIALAVGRNDKSTTFSGALTGTTGGFIKTGAGRLDLTGDTNKMAYAGGVTVNGGILALSGSGQLTNTGAAAFTLIDGGTFILDNSGTDNTNRLTGPLPGITFQGGTFRFAGKDATASSESLGAAAFSGGASTIDIVNGAGGSCDVTFSAATIGAGTVNFTASGGGTLGSAGSNPRVKFTGLAAGLVGYATVNGSSPAYNDAVNGIRAYTLGESTEFDGSAVQTALDTKFTTANLVPQLTAARIVNSLWIDSPGPGKFVDLGSTGNSNLTITSGRINLTGTDNFEIKRSGTSTATLTAGSRLFFNVDNSGGALTSSVPIATGANTVSKEGPGILVLNATNTFTGTLTIEEGTVKYGANGQIADTAPVTIWGSGILDMNNVTDGIGAITIYSGGITNSGAGGVLTNTTLTMGSGPAGSSAFVNTGSGSLKLGGAVTFNVANDPNTAIIAGTIDLNGATRTFTVNDSVAAGAAIDLDVQAVINGAATYGITKAGTGAMRLSGANTFDGPTTVTGTLLLKHAQALGVPTASRTLTVNGGSSVVLDGVGISSANLPLSLNGTGNTLLGPVSGALVNRAGNNTVAGAVTLAAASQIASLKAGDKLTLLGGISGGNNTVTVYGGGDVELSGVLGNGSGTLTKNGNGALTLSGSGANTFTGATAINGGTLVLAKANGANAVNAIVSGALTVNNGGIVQYASASANPDLIGTAAATLNGTGQLDFNGASDTIGNVLIVATGATTNTTPIVNTAGGGNLTIGTLGITPVAGYVSRINTGSGALALGGNVTFTAATTGRGQISGNLALNGATRSFAVGAGTGPDYDLDIDAVISGGAGFGLTMTTGRLRLSGANTYPGDTTITSGTLQYGKVDAIPSGAGKGNVLVTGTLDVNGFSPTVNGVSGAGTIDNTAAGTAMLTAGANDQTGAFSGVIKNTAGALALTKTGTGALTLSGANTFNGGLFINAGAVTGTVANALGGTGTGAVTLGDSSGSAGATLRAGAAITLANPLAVRAGTSGVLTLGTVGNFAAIFSGAVTLNNDLTIDSGTGSGSVTLNNAAGGITGSGTMTVNGSGTSSVTLSGVNTNFTGGVVVNTGLLKMGNASALNASNAVAVNAGATFDLNANSETIAGLNNGAGGGGTVTNSGAAKTLTLGGSGTYAFGGVLGAGTPANLALTVALTGGGKQTLAGACRYTGATTINSGTLVVSNSLASVVTNNSGGILAGIGPFNARVTAKGGARLVPGIGVGTMTMTNGLVLTNSPAVDFEFKADLSAGDLIDVTGGTLTITNGTVAVNLYAEGTVNSAALTNGTYNLMKYVGTAPAYTNLYVANPAPSKQYSFDLNGGYVRVAVQFDPAPQITTIGATNVTASSAYLNGFLVSTGASDTVVSVYWGPGGDQGTNITAAWAFTNFFGTNTDLPAEGLAYSTNVGSLTAGQLYTYRYRATNGAGVAWGAATNFIPLIVPTVDNDGGATAIGATAGILRGTLLNGSPTPQVKIYWGTADGSTNKGAWDRPALDLGPTALGSFSAGASGLLANQQYWYRCYASNDLGDAWAPASSNFTTTPPGVSINDTGVLEGALGSSTAMVFTVALSAISAVDVTVSYGTSNGTATVSDNDHAATNGSLTIPAGSLTGLIAVAVIGDNICEANETLYVNLSNLVNATSIDVQGMGTITNDDWTVYVRGDGLGSDTNNGGTWAMAFASLQKAFTFVPGSDYYDPDGFKDSHGWELLSTPNRIHVQASTGSQAYAAASRSSGAIDVEFQGGWVGVDGAPAQTGLSVVTNAGGPGISTSDGGHGNWRRLIVNRFLFTNVTRAVQMVNGSGTDAADMFLMVSNTTIYAMNDGLYVRYPRTAITGYGGRAVVLADSVNIVAGLAGTGTAHGVFMDNTPWMGSRVTATGTNAATGEPRVSTITTTNGCGVCFTASNTETDDAAIFNTVVYGCSSNGIYLASSAGAVQATLKYCTISDNAGDGLQMVSGTANSSATTINSIFANNDGHGINLVGGAGVFSCSEGYDVLYNDDILMNGSPRAISVTSANTDPLFHLRGDRPDPWYKLGSKISPAYLSATPSGHRGAYQTDRAPNSPTVFVFR